MFVGSDASNKKHTIVGLTIIVVAIIILVYTSFAKDPASSLAVVVNNDISELSTEKKQGIKSTSKPSTKHQVVLCMVFTTPEQWNRKALAVRLTWIKRCDFYKFLYSKREDVHLDGAYALDVPEGRDHLTAKTMLGFRLAFEKYSDKVDWYLKCDDDSYFIMENLRHLLSSLDATQPHYLGHKSNDFLMHGYNSGGAGYVLSSSAVKLLVESGDMYPDKCPTDGGIEDLDLGRCLESFRVFPGETNDSEGRIRFHPDHPIKLLLGEHNALEVYQYSKANYTFGHHKGIKVMSEETISFHYMEPGYIYMYDFLLYDLKRHGQT